VKALSSSPSTAKKKKVKEKKGNPHMKEDIFKSCLIRGDNSEYIRNP
jgi:hypothetical protein